MSRRRRPRPLTVLLVEDDGAVRRVIRDMLRQCGCVVREAADGAGALEALAGGIPDVVVLDLVLPGLNGLQVLERLSASGSAATVPVVAITGSIVPDDVMRARGARAVLRKPFAALELRRALDRVAAGTRGRKSAPHGERLSGFASPGPPVS